MTALDNVAARRGLEVVAQTADPAFASKAMQTRAFMDAEEFEDQMSHARLIVAHAGMGAIIAALEHRKPLVLMARKASLGEHRNDHQLATVRRFAGMPGLTVVDDEVQLDTAIHRAHGPEFDIAPPPARRRSLIDAVRLAIG